MDKYSRKIEKDKITGLIFHFFFYKWKNDCFLVSAYLISNWKTNY